MAGKRRGTDPLRLPAVAMVSGRARELRKHADAAISRLADPGDVEALHDTRVALRRLRGWTRAFPEQLRLGHGQRRALRALAHMTNPARDMEVCQEWLVRLLGKPPRGRDAVKPGFAEELEKLRRRSHQEIRAVLPPLWRKFSRRLKRSIDRASRRQDPREFAVPFSTSLGVYTKELDTELQRARRKPAPVRIHTLRIAAKRVRYLAEVASPWHPGLEMAVRGLRTLHDSAGAIQDLQRLLALIERSFLRRAEPRQRGWLALYLAPHTHRRRLPVGVTPELGALLNIAHAVAVEQGERIAAFHKRHLAAHEPPYLRRLRYFMESHRALARRC